VATGIAPQDTGPSRKPTAGKGRGVQPAGKFVEFDKYIDGQLRRTRGQVKMTEVAVGLMTLCIAVLLFFLAIALLDHWVIHRGFSGFERFFLFAALIGGGGYYFVRYIVPAMLGRVNPIYAAHTIERSKPSLKNSLINFLLFRQKPDTVHGVVFRAMEEQAATGLSRVPIESAVDRTRLIHLGYVLIGCVMALALYFVFSPKNPLVSAHRVLMPWADVAAPSRVTISDIQPRDTSAFRGQPVQVSADIEGLSGDEEAKLIYTTAGGQVVDRAVALTAPQGSRHLGQMPDGKDGLQQDVSYRIEAGDAQSGTYHVKLIDAPTIIVDSVEYKFPDYTGNPQKTDPRGDLKAIEGTQVTIHATANQPIKTATVDFNCDGKHTSPMKVSGQTATFTFNLTLNEARTGPQFDSYQLRMVNDRKTENPQPIKHRITVLPDLPPEVNFMAPEREEVMVPLDGQVSLELRAIDPDFSLTAVRVRGKTERGSVFDQSLLPDAPHSGGFVGKYQFAPAQFGLKEGDIVRYQAVATDNKTPTANETVTPDRRIKIGAAENRNPQQQPNNAAQSDKPNNGQQPPRPNDRNNPPRQGNQQNNSTAKDNHTPDKGQQNDAAQPPNNDPKNNGQDKDPNSNPTSNPNNGEQPKNNDQQQPGDDKQQPQNNGQPDNKNPHQGNEQKQNDPKPNDQKQPESKPSDNGGQKNDPQQKKQDNSQGKSDQSQSKSDKQQNGSDKQQGKGSGDPSQGQGGGKSQSQNGGKDSQQNGASDASQSGGSNANQSSGGNSPPNGNNNPQPASNDPSQNNQNQSGANQSTSPNQQGNPNQQKSDAGGNAQQNPGNGQRGNDKGPKTNERPPADQSPVPADGSDDGRGVERILDHNKPQSPQNNAKPGNSDKNNSAAEQSSGEKNGTEKSEEKSGGDKTNGEKPGGEKPDTDKSGDKKNGGDKSANSQNGAEPKTGTTGGQRPDGQQPNGQQPGSNQNQTPGGSKSDDPKSSPQPKPADGTNPVDKTPSGKTPSDKPPSDKNQTDNPATSGNPGDKQDKPNDGSTGNPSKQQKTDANQNPTPQSPSASSSNSNGNADAGQDNKDGKGSPDQQQDMKGREKQPGDASKAGEPPNDAQSPSISKKESDSKGGEDGDRSGGGKSGGGQKANQQGKGQPGQNTPSDEGAGKSSEPGKGENSNQPGGDKKSDHPTGQQGGEKGNGSSSPPAGNPKGDPGQGVKGEPQPNNQNPKSNDPGQQPDSKGQGADGKGQQSSGGKQSNTGSVQGSGQNSGDQVPDKAGDYLQSGEAPPVDDPNLSYAKKATELAIDRLKSALNNDKQGDNLLHDLGWSRDETEQFIRRQEERLQNAERPNPEDPLRRQAEDGLRSLGLRPDRAIRAKGGVTSDAQRGMSSGRQSAPPPDYAEQFKEYNRALNSSGQSGK
jgi:hypothetical protein